MERRRVVADGALLSAVAKASATRTSTPSLRHALSAEGLSASGFARSAKDGRYRSSNLEHRDGRGGICVRAAPPPSPLVTSATQGCHSTPGAMCGYQPGRANARPGRTRCNYLIKGRNAIIVSSEHTPPTDQPPAAISRSTRVRHART
jgi:hypothetical protein